MTPIVSSLIFAAALYVAFLCGIVVEIFVIGHFEGAIGSRFDNLLYSAAVAIPISLSVTLGYGAVLAYRRRVHGVFGLNSRWVAGSGLVACAFVYAYGFVMWSLPDSWHISVAAAVVYFVVLGAIIAVCVVVIPQSHANAV